MPEPMPDSWYEYLGADNNPNSAKWVPPKARQDRDAKAERIFIGIAKAVWLMATVTAVILGAHEKGVKGVAVALFAVSPIVAWFCFLFAGLPFYSTVGTQGKTVADSADLTPEELLYTRQGISLTQLM